MHKTITSLIFALASALLAASCDDGPVDETAAYSQEGHSVRLTATLSGLQTWDGSLYVALAAFNDESDYAITSRRISGTNGTVDVTLSGITEEATRVELCVLNNLRQRVATFATLEGDALLSGEETTLFDAGTLSVSMLSAVQTSVFNTTCTGCHGGNGGAAAGLFLTDGRSHEALVGKPSKKVADGTLVKAGDAEGSVLYQTLTTALSKGWHYDHTAEVIDQRRRSLIQAWIDGGAEE